VEIRIGLKAMNNGLAVWRSEGKEVFSIAIRSHTRRDAKAQRNGEVPKD